MDRPDDAGLRGADLMDIGRAPVTPEAKAFVAAVWEVAQSHKERKRKVGAGTVATDLATLGALLAGIMRAGIVGRPVRVPRAKMSGMWDAPVIGYKRVWDMLDAMTAAGLLGVAPGVKSQRSVFPGEFVQEGLATCLWPSDTLDAMAASSGLVRATRKTDWMADASRVAKPATIAQLVVCRSLRDGQTDVPIIADMDGAEAEAMRADLRAINDLLASTVIRGAGAVIGVRRTFRHSLDLHGRHYTGHGTLQQAAQEERLRITFDGEPCAEVDVKASQITVALGMTGHSLGADGTLPRRDLYAVPGIPRAIVKAWMVRTMGNGRATWTRWGDDPPSGWEAFKPKDVWRAVRPLYPFLEDLSALVPRALLDTLPAPSHHWAGGQFVVAREARIVGAAMSYCVQHGVPVLPVHDSFVVPESKVGVAVDGLMGAFVAIGGVLPQLRTDYAPGYIKQV